ncbi:hypothetical protein C0Q70_15711 [Pomacea canaliculata]|uniref:Uncharacterized protein n=1 Tax=Pomacea canaliculata TaxID=400727 RepID=A0A2T7NVM0_POMCA|nr:hypothetical protein C0Q70_15711 [Pomacea canaliculata]
MALKTLPVVESALFYRFVTSSHSIQTSVEAREVTVAMTLGGSCERLGGHQACLPREEGYTISLQIQSWKTEGGGRDLQEIAWNPRAQTLSRIGLALGKAIER